MVNMLIFLSLFLLLLRSGWCQSITEQTTYQISVTLPSTTSTSSPQTATAAKDQKSSPQLIQISRVVRDKKPVTISSTVTR